MAGILVRVRSQLGMWRFPGVNPDMTVADFMHRIAEEKGVPMEQQHLSKDASHKQPMEASARLRSNGVVSNGDMLFLRIDEAADVMHSGSDKLVGRKIGADGSIVAMSYDEANASGGFRPGMPRLRDIKGAWTLTDFLEMDEQFVYRFKKEKGKNVSEMCTAVTLDGEAANSFVIYLQEVGWSQERVGFLYGTVEDDKSVTVHAIYEPPQDNTSERFQLLEDPRAEQVERLASMLNLKRVGWIFGHPPRENGFFLSSQELIFATMQQLEAADGVEETPFVTVRVRPDEHGKGEFDAFQVTLQGMDMVAEGALEEDPKDRVHCAISPTFTAIVEGKLAKSVHNQMFLLNVRLKHSLQPRFRRVFPDANRIGSVQSPELLKDCMASAGSTTGALSDFNLLLFLMDFKDMFHWDNDMPRICEAVTNPEVALDAGYDMLIRGFAGMELED